MNIISLKVAIIEPLPIIRSGLEVLLKKIPGYKIQFIDAPSDGGWTDVIALYKPDVIFINPIISGLMKNDSDKTSPQSKYIALMGAPIDKTLLHCYDDTLSICSTVEEIKQLLEKLYEKSQEAEDTSEQQSLTNREKEIVVGVVKGMTNKEIAEDLFLSTHTVITHRRNIAKKLQIHSPSGLTIYAIMNKLVNLDEISH